MSFRFAFVFAGSLVLCGFAGAQDYKAGNLLIEHPYARSTVAGQTSGAVYLSVENKGKRADKLIGATSPAAASVQIHTMSMDGNVMKMREMGDIALKQSSKITMQPGDGYHMMMIGLKRQLKAGDKFPLTLRFETSGKLEIQVVVE